MKNYFILTTLLATALFSGCSNEDEPNAPVQGTPITFTIDNNGVMTKTSTVAQDATYKTTFNTNDEIGVYATGSAQGTNVKYTFDATGNTLTSSSPIMMGVGSAKIYAYTPYLSEQNEDGKISFTINEDQNVDGNFDKSNLLGVETTINCANSTVTGTELTFKPLLSLLRIELKGEQGKQVTKVVAKAKPTLTWTYEAASDNKAVAGDLTNINLFHENSASASTAESQIFTAFIPGQEIASNSIFLTLSTPDRNYVFTPSSSISLTAGYVNKMTITIENDKVSVTATAVQDHTWDNNAEETTIAAYDASIENNLIVEPTAITSQSMDNINDDAWNLIQTDAGLSVNATATAGTIKMEITSAATETSWYKKVLVYKASTEFDLDKTYQLSFKVSSAETGKLYTIVYYHPDSSTNKAYGIKNETSEQYSYPINTGVEQSITFIINPKRITSSNLSGSASFTDNSEAKSFMIGFIIDHTALTTYTIKDVKLTEVSSI